MRLSLLVLALVLTLAGCAAPRPAERADLRAITPLHAWPLYDEDGQRIEKPSTARADGHLEILALSGGGSSGAYGAGVLYGWSETGTRPEFDIVTGVSSGALMGALIFAGPKHDDTLRRAYTEVTNDDVYTRRSLASMAFSDAIYDFEPMKEMIAQILTPEVLDDIAAEHRKGRRFYVATTNLDGGRLVVWDIGALAASDRPNKLLRTRKILRASAAVPGLFGPVYIKPRRGIERRQAHVDGGVKTPLLLESFMLSVPASRRSVYVVVNNDMRLNNDTAPVEATVADVAYKSLQEMLRGSFTQALFRSYTLTRNAGGKYHVTWIPDDGPLIADPVDFDPVKMKELFEAGRAFIRRNDWSPIPPRLSSLAAGAR